MFKALRILQDLKQGEHISSDGWEAKILPYPGQSGEPIPCKYFIPKGKIDTDLIIFPGASPFGEDHPALNVLGAALARQRIQVIVPRIPLLMNLELTPEIIPSMCHFYDWYTNQTLKRSIKIAGVSYGGAMVLKCLSEKPFLDFPPESVLVYGTHYDLLNSINMFFEPEPRRLTSEWPLIVFFHNFLNRIDPGYDTSQLKEFLSRRVKNDEALDLIETLTGMEQELASALADGRITEEIRRLTPLILESCTLELDFFSPSKWDQTINNKVFVLHGSQDVMVHWTQSKELAKTLPNSKLLITHLFEHRDMVSGGKKLKMLAEMTKLVWFIHTFLKK